MKASDIRVFHLAREWAGKEAVFIATPFVHRWQTDIETEIEVPLTHIVGSIATMAKDRGYSTLAVLGTKWTMLDSFYTERLEAQGIATLVPDEETCREVDQVIFDELTQGVFTDASRARYVEIMNDLKTRGADAVALSCTEIGLLVSPETAPLPAIDSVDAHVASSVEWMMAEEQTLLTSA